MRYFLCLLAVAGFIVAIWQRTPVIMPISTFVLVVGLWPHALRSVPAPQLPQSRPANTRPVERTGTERKSA